MRCFLSPRFIATMSSDRKYDDDEYVAKLLAEDAKKTSVRYAQHGLSALLPRRPTGAAPKPNTRFLKTLVREVDSHNAALKKKEELEARIRQRQLRERGSQSRRGEHHEDRDERPSKRRRQGHEESTKKRRQKRHESREYCRNSSSDRSRSRENSRNERKYDDRYDHADRSLKSRSTRDRKRPRSSSSSDFRTRHQQDRNHSPRRRGALRESRHDWDRLSEPPSPNTASARMSPVISNTRVKHESVNSEVEQRFSSSESESDPLESIVGPIERPHRDGSGVEQPPTRSKGRGAFKPSRAAMDSHFTSDYNPSMDVHPESELEDEKEDWDMALEAFRDREMFKRKHAERLREAGFGDSEISKWKDTGKEKDVSDVRWNSKDEAREWDLGKPT